MTTNQIKSIQFKGEKVMDIFIYDLDVNMVDKFINPSTDLYGRIVRKESERDRTVDLLINVRAVAIDDNHIIMEYPNNAVCVVNIPSFHYHKIEVM